MYAILAAKSFDSTHQQQYYRKRNPMKSAKPNKTGDAEKYLRLFAFSYLLLANIWNLFSYTYNFECVVLYCVVLLSKKTDVTKGF